MPRPRPILAKDGPPLVVPPSVADLQVTRRETFQLEAASFQTESTGRCRAGCWPRCDEGVARGTRARARVGGRESYIPGRRTGHPPSNPGKHCESSRVRSGSGSVPRECVRPWRDRRGAPRSRIATPAQDSRRRRSPWSAVKTKGSGIGGSPELRPGTPSGPKRSAAGGGRAGRRARSVRPLRERARQGAMVRGGVENGRGKRV